MGLFLESVDLNLCEILLHITGWIYNRCPVARHW